MLQSKRQNYHHSELPALGDIVTLPALCNHGYTGRWIVEAFPLCDNILPYSIGIHTVILASLHNRNVKIKVSGFYCQ